MIEQFIRPVIPNVGCMPHRCGACLTDGTCLEIQLMDFHVNCHKILNMLALSISGEHENFRRTKVGHGPKSIRKHCMRPINRTLSDTTTLGQSVSENNGIEEILHIP